MSSRHLVDPELLASLDLFPAITYSAELLPMLRERVDAMNPPAPASPAGGMEFAVRKVTSAEGHDIQLLIHRPKTLPAHAPAVLHIHGGGFVVGSAAMMRVANEQLAAQAECVVVSVDYRLAPETTHPGPLEDCYAALQWLYDNAGELTIDPARIAVAGESAGAGLAAAVALLARDRGDIRLIHQHLIFPMLDDRTCRQNIHPFAGEFGWSPESNQFGWSALLGEPAGREGISPYAAPARAADLSGLPSTFISVGALDLFLEEDMRYAQSLIRAGVPTELHVYPGAFHGFSVASEAAVTKKANYNSLLALRRALHG